MVSYNDATRDYLKYMIKMEEEKHESIRNIDVLEGHKNSLAVYKRQKELIEFNLKYFERNIIGCFQG